MQKPNTDNSEYRHLLRKARDAAHGGEPAWHVQSTGEKLAVAMVLNQPEWIASMGYSLPEAIDRVGLEWLAFIPDVARQLARDAITAGPKE
jgi:hypothetical protein